MASGHKGLSSLLSILTPIHFLPQHALITENTPWLDCRTFFGMTPIFQTSDYNMVKQIAITNFSNFPNRSRSPNLNDDPILTHNLLELQGDHWKHVRSTLTPVFSSGKLKQVKHNFHTVHLCIFQAFLLFVFYCLTTICFKILSAMLILVLC